MDEFLREKSQTAIDNQKVLRDQSPESRFTVTQESVQDELAMAMKNLIAGLDGIGLKNKYGNDTLDADAIGKIQQDMLDATNKMEYKYQAPAPKPTVTPDI